MTGSVDREAEYYQAVEEFFVSRRGDPLFLSNADWLLIRNWRRAGVPLRVVLRGIADALDGHAHSWARRRKVGSLAYCAAEVELSRERWERALAVGADDPDGLAVSLASFTEALRSATGLGPRAKPAARTLAAELTARAESHAAARDVEAWLREEEARLLAALEADAGPEQVALWQKEVDAQLAPYRGRMPHRVLAQVHADAVARRLLEAHGLPRFSLFHL